MRLLNIKTFKLHAFVDAGEKKTPPYAILSHTWAEGELSFDDVARRLPGRKKKAGYAKVKGFCRQVQKERRDLQYVWVDTCCINRGSSAELTEAITSMWNWYRDADVCYAYLADVAEEGADPSARRSEFRSSRWFTRGWTLQELLAPRAVVFYDAAWRRLGTKAGLAGVLEDVTDVPAVYLVPGQGERDIMARLESTSVAMRMSWAARRTTTRVEDTAYCLMGLFNVTMPIIYGEGARAFTRLQEDIIRGTGDQSLFAWGLDVALCRLELDHPGGVLARHPRDFVRCGGLHPLRPLLEPVEPIPFGMTNVGLEISLPVRVDASSGTALVVLNCGAYSPTLELRYVVLPLLRPPRSRSTLQRTLPCQPRLVSAATLTGYRIMRVYLQDGDGATEGVAGGAGDQLASGRDHRRMARPDFRRNMVPLARLYAFPFRWVDIYPPRAALLFRDDWANYPGLWLTGDHHWAGVPCVPWAMLRLEDARGVGFLMRVSRVEGTTTWNGDMELVWQFAALPPRNGGGGHHGKAKRRRRRHKSANNNRDDTDEDDFANFQRAFEEATDQGDLKLDFDGEGNGVDDDLDLDLNLDLPQDGRHADDFNLLEMAPDFDAVPQDAWTDCLRTPDWEFVAEKRTLPVYVSPALPHGLECDVLALEMRRNTGKPIASRHTF